MNCKVCALQPLTSRARRLAIVRMIVLRGRFELSLISHLRNEASHDKGNANRNDSHHDARVEFKTAVEIVPQPPLPNRRTRSSWGISLIFFA